MGRHGGGWRSDGSVVWAVVVAAALIASGTQAGGQEDGAGVDRSGWKAADPGYALVFPRDHAAHPDHRIEW